MDGWILPRPSTEVVVAPAGGTVSALFPLSWLSRRRGLTFECDLNKIELCVLLRGDGDLARDAVPRRVGRDDSAGLVVKDNVHLYAGHVARD